MDLLKRQLLHLYIHIIRSDWKERLQNLYSPLFWIKLFVLGQLVILGWLFPYYEPTIGASGLPASVHILPSLVLLVEGINLLTFFIKGRFYIPRIWLRLIPASYRSIVVFYIWRHFLSFSRMGIYLLVLSALFSQYGVGRESFIILFQCLLVSATFYFSTLILYYKLDFSQIWLKWFTLGLSLLGMFTLVWLCLFSKENIIWFIELPLCAYLMYTCGQFLSYHSFLELRS